MHLTSQNKPQKKQKKESFFELFCQAITSFIGSHAGTMIAILIFVVSCAALIWDSESYWSDLLEKIFTMTSLVLLIFLQRSQNKDTLSLQIKLNELLSAHGDADSGLINAEKRSEEELQQLHDEYAVKQEQGELAKNNSTDL